MKRSQFMIMDYPNLVKYFASKNPFHLLFKVAPLWGLFGYLMISSESTFSSLITAFFGGVLYWTFLEYVIHRFAYHSPYKSKLLYYFLGSFHLYHHKDMSDHRILNAGFLMIYLITPLVLLPFTLFNLGLGTLSSMGLGLTLSYFFYEWVHYILHYKVHGSGYLNYIQKFHFYHHDKALHKNFGNTSHLWDVLLGTYDEKYQSYEMPDATKKTMITEKDMDGVYAQS